MQITQKPLPLAKLCQSYIVQHHETGICRNYPNDLSTDVGVMAPGTAFLDFWHVHFKNLHLKNRFTEFNESLHNCSLEYPTQNGRWNI